MTVIVYFVNSTRRYKNSIKEIREGLYDRNFTLVENEGSEYEVKDVIKLEVIPND